MTLSDIAKDNFKPRIIIGDILWCTNSAHEVFQSHRFKGINSNQWTRPLKIGKARKGFVDHCKIKVAGGLIV